LEHAAPQWLKDHFEDLALFMEAIQPIDGFGVRIDQSPKGRMIHADGGTRAGTAATAIPFELLDASDESDNKIRVRKGVVMEYGTANEWIPTGMFPGDDPTFVEDAVGTDGVVYLEITVDGDGDVLSLTIGVAATLPAATTTVGYKVLGHYATNDSVFSVLSEDIGSQNYLHCGGGHYFWS
jgi:hypothetical protein